jgi:hypothetical protein
VVKPINPFIFLVCLVLGIAVFSAIALICITALAPANVWPRFEPLVETFKWAWVASIGALLGLLGGKATN